MRTPRLLLRLQRPYERFWLSFAVSPAKLAVFRFAWFGVLGLDSLLQVEHAPRYGAGGFNVGQLAWLDAVVPAPSRPLILVVFLLQAYLAFCVALGVGRRLGVWLLTALYGYSYFVSQLDSYQHHYLVFLMLAIASFVPWKAAGGGGARAGRGDGEQAKRATDAREQPAAEQTADTPAISKKAAGKKAAGKKAAGKKAAGKKAAGKRATGGRAGAKPARAGSHRLSPAYIASWALRLLVVQVAIVYLWAAVAKLSDSLWRDGVVLQAQIRALGGEVKIAWIRDIVGDHGQLMSWAVALGELFLAGALLVRRLWPLAFVIGVGFHVGVILAGFQIGLFSYFMLAFYLLLLPDAWYDAAARVVASELRSGASGPWRRPGVALASIAAAATAGVVVLARLPFAEWTIVAVGALGGLTMWIAAIVRSSDTVPVRSARVVRAALAHAAACALIPALVAVSDQGFSYYKYWGGASRRLGDDAGLRAAYTELIRRWPDAYGPAYYHLANAELRAGHVDAALADFRRAQELVREEDYRPFLAEAQIHSQAGRGAEAVRAARAALARMTPGTRDYQRATAIIERWTR